MNDASIAAPAQSRLAALDNLRTAVIILVVGMHSNVTYSGLGSWYYVENDADDLPMGQKVAFAFYGSNVQAWFMGALFLLVGFFAAKGLAKRGTAAFLKERAFRLGIPLLLYVFVVTPFIVYVQLNPSDVRSLWSPARFYCKYLASFDWLGATGPLWFAQAALLMVLAYAGYRRFRPSTWRAPLTMRSVAVSIAITAVAAFVLRIPFPVGSSFYNLQFGYFASYVVLFVLGVRLGETDGLADAIAGIGRRWWPRAAIGGPVAWAVAVVAIMAAGDVDAMNGGGTWQSALWAAWESFVAIGFTFGVMWCFTRYASGSSRIAGFLARQSFAVYFLHAPVLIAISLALKAWDAAPLLKHLAVWPLAVAASFAVATVVRAIPPFGRILK